ncbi:MAG: hypothetical protein JXA10_12030, partial [Anaerolineae bacterium]|nr:hypothetical protein [Anaerolineae bacterium]
MKRHISIILALIIVLVLIFSNSLAILNAQITIPTATPMPTATLSPEQVALGISEYGLQSSDVEGFVPSATNYSGTLDDLIAQLMIEHPDREAVVQSLGVL